MPDTAKPFWDARETAEYLGLTAASVRVMVKQKVLAGYMVGEKGGRIRIKPSDVLAYLEGCRMGPKAEPKPVARRLPPVEIDHFGPNGWRKVKG